MAKIYAISDIHGYLDEFIDALNKVNLNDKDNRLFLLGDYLDNGLQSFQVISKIIELEEIYPNQIITLLMKLIPKFLFMQALMKKQECFGKN